MIHPIEMLCCSHDAPLIDRLSERSGLCRMIWIREGKGHVLIDLQTFSVRRNTVCLITPGQMYRLKPDDIIQGYLINFSSTILNRLSCFTEVSQPVHEEPGGIEEMLELIMEEHARCPAMGAQLPAALMELLFIDLMRMHPVRTNVLPVTDTYGLAGKFLQLLHENIAARKKVSDFADELAITPNHLNQIMKRASGFSVKYHIQQHLLLEAKRRIVHLGAGAKQVAHCLGFEDTAHFSKFFKRCAGMTFSEFRRSICKQTPLKL
jgi:AraC family transcriptional activator of pobA